MRPTISPRSEINSIRPTRRFDRSATKPDLRLHGIDLGAEIQQSNRAVAVSWSFGNHRTRQPPGNSAAPCRGNSFDDQAIGASTPSLMRGPLPALMYSVRRKIDEILVEPPASAGSVRAPFEHRLLDLEVARL